MMLRPTVLLIASLMALTACGDDGVAATSPKAAGGMATSADPVAPARVTIARSRFDDVELRIIAGTTVVFENTDAFVHTITSADASPVEFDSGEIGQDQTFEITFDEAGEYPYFCRIHPTMRAVVIVE
jgi:plastocyanin